MVQPDQDPQLPEKDFINEGYSRDPGTLWIWLAFIAVFLAMIWGIGSQYSSYLSERTQDKPFLQVSNRDMSIFLWQNPEFMRANVKSKSGYLPAFEYLGKVTVNPQAAQQWVVGPPELLFRYHTWVRLLRGEITVRPIFATEFMEFLEYDEQWQPENWPTAPAGYKDLVKSMNPLSKDDLQKLPENTFPRIVRLAFQGWKNFRYEGEKIEAASPTYKDLTAFLKVYPHYGRSYWRNIVDSGRRQYLKSVTSETADSDERVPNDELTPFLKVAFYNYQQAEKNQ